MEIHGQRYVSLDLSFERIPGMPGFSTQEIKKKVAEMPASWKASYGKTALRISPASKKVSRSSVPQQVYALDALQERFYPHLDHRKQVRIEGQEYLALNPQSFPALKNADPSWKKKYRRYARNPLTRSLRTVFTTTGLVELGIPLPESTPSVKKEISTQVRMRKRKHAS